MSAAFRIGIENRNRFCFGSTSDFTCSERWLIAGFLEPETGLVLAEKSVECAAAGCVFPSSLRSGGPPREIQADHRLEHAQSTCTRGTQTKAQNLCGKYLLTRALSQPPDVLFNTSESPLSSRMNKCRRSGCKFSVMAPIVSGKPNLLHAPLAAGKRFVLKNFFCRP